MKDDSSTAGKDPLHSGTSGSIATISKSIDWYHEGEARVVEVAGTWMTVRYLGRKGRRARIVIEAPCGATFRTCDTAESNASPSGIDLALGCSRSA